MRRVASIGIVLLCAFVSSGLRPAAGAQPAPAQDLLDRRITLELGDATLRLALGTLSATYDVPIGVEYSVTHSDQRTINLDFKDGTIKEVLDSIVKQEPLYRWELVDGVVNVVPTRDRDPFIEAFLNTPVDRFDPGKWTSIFQVREAIGHIPEVRRMLEANRKTFYTGGVYVKRPSIYAKKDVDLSISRTTVRGLLNRIIGESEHNFWSIGWARANKDAVSISF